LYNPRATIDYIDVYIYENNQKINEYHLGDMVPNSQKTFQGKYTYFYLDIKPHATYTIVSDLRSSGVISVHWVVVSLSDFLKKYSFETTIFSIYVGIMFFLLYQKPTMVDSIRGIQRYDGKGVVHELYKSTLRYRS